MSAFLDLPVIRIGSEGATDQVAVEEPLEILINGRNLAITMRTPGDDEELAAGFLFTEGLIRNVAEFLRISGAGNQVNVELAAAPDVAPRLVMTSACGVCGKSSIDKIHATGCKPIPAGTFTIATNVLSRLPALLRQSQKVFEHTGGLHAAGLFTAEGELQLIREDVGRHNAVDKLIGAALLRTSTLATTLLLVSGRASFELVQKAAMAGIPLLAAVGAPSSLAVETAQRFNMSLVGFLRDDRMNIYTGAERITEAA